MKGPLRNVPSGSPPPGSGGGPAAVRRRSGVRRPAPSGAGVRRPASGGGVRGRSGAGPGPVRWASCPGPGKIKMPDHGAGLPDSGCRTAVRRRTTAPDRPGRRAARWTLRTPRTARQEPRASPAGGTAPRRLGGGWPAAIGVTARRPLRRRSGRRAASAPWARVRGRRREGSARPTRRAPSSGSRPATPARAERARRRSRRFRSNAARGLADPLVPVLVPHRRRLPQRSPPRARARPRRPARPRRGPEPEPRRRPSTRRGAGIYFSQRTVD